MLVRKRRALRRPGFDARVALLVRIRPQLRLPCPRRVPLLLRIRLPLRRPGSPCIPLLLRIRRPVRRTRGRDACRPAPPCLFASRFVRCSAPRRQFWIPGAVVRGEKGIDAVGIRFVVTLLFAFEEYLLPGCLRGRAR